MPGLQPLVEEECERPEVEVIDCILGHHVKVCCAICCHMLSFQGLHHC